MMKYADPQDTPTASLTGTSSTASLGRDMICEMFQNPRILPPSNMMM
jgi:hypothetical protein